VEHFEGRRKGKLWFSEKTTGGKGEKFYLKGIKKSAIQYIRKKR